MSRSPEPFGFAQDKLCEGVAIAPVAVVLLRDCFVATLLAMTLYLMRSY